MAEKIGALKDVKVGDKLFVVKNYQYSRKRQECELIVFKVGREYVSASRDGSPDSWAKTRFKIVSGFAALENGFSVDARAFPSREVYAETVERDALFSRFCAAVAGMNPRNLTQADIRAAYAVLCPGETL